LQKHVTGNATRNRSGPGNKYIANFARQWVLIGEFVTDAGNARYYEFGAGADLGQNLYNYCRGLNYQWLIDIFPLLKLELVHRLISQLRANPPPGAIRVPPQIAGSNFIPALKDANAVESRRIMTCRDVMVSTIDYRDHYSYFDKSIGIYNFLRFDAQEWEGYNSQRHYQSRARHPQYRDIFTAAGFTIEREIIERPDDWREQLATVPVHSHFQKSSIEDLSIAGCTFVLRPK
jgi:hypothetical protein